MLDQFSEIIYYFKGIIRNKWVITIVAGIICLGGWAFVYKMPDVYQSEARVHVDTRSMLRPLLRGLAVETDVRGMVAIMKKLMFTQRNMIEVAEIAGMDIDLTSESNIRSVVNKLKANLVIGGGKEQIFAISYESEDAQNAKDVVQAVLTVFSEQSQKSNLSDVDSAERFLDNQIREYEQRLRNAERAKENFKRNNIGLLPGQGGAGQVGQIQAIRQQIEDSKSQLLEIQSRKQVLNEQLEEAFESSDEWGLTEELTDSSSIEDARITDLLNRKNELLLRYTDNHPSIVSIEKLIKSIQKQNEENIDDEAFDEFDDSEKAMSNPYAQSIKIALNSVDAEIATIKTRIKSLNEKLQSEDKQFNARLAIETEMDNLNRDYGTIKKNYLSLIDRREQARMSSSVDTQVSALKFKIVDPANLPLEPSSPKRMLLYSAVLAIGFIAGIGLALLMVFIKPTFVEAKQLRALTGLPVLGVISEVVNKAQAKKNSTRLITYLSVNVLLLLGYSGVMLSDVLF
jgi:polysaccharide chain length determinant protein (PEP-CTERM system associated)